jgi:hypothetical protein
VINITKDELTEQEKTEILNVTIVIVRAMDALNKVNTIIGNKEKNALSEALDVAHTTCLEAYRGDRSASDLKAILDLLFRAKNAIELLNYALESKITSDLSRDLYVAWWNTNQITKGYTEYKKYE